MDIDAQHLVGAQLIFVDRVTDSQLVSWNLASCIVLLSFFFLKLIYFLLKDNCFTEFWSLKKKIIYLIYLAGLGFCGSMGFSHCGSLVVVPRLLIAVASLVAEHGL